MAVQSGTLSTATASLAVLVLVVVGSAVVASRVRWLSVRYRHRERLVRGLPIGSLLICVFLWIVFGIVQQGWSGPPTTIPFRSWSYFEPLGTMSSSFAHSSTGHLFGNLLGTLTVGTLAEYHWGHRPTTPAPSGGRLRRWLVGTTTGRITVFVGGSLVVGVLSGLFSLGPTIGYSGVVFAYIGFTLVARPIWTVLALLSTRILDLLFQALTSPVVTSGGHTSFITPWWARISIHGHLLGLFLGVVLGLWLVRRRDIHTRPLVVWGAVLLIAAMEGLWALYLPVGGGRYTLYRALGVAGVLLMSIVVALAADRTRSATRWRTAATPMVVGVLLVLSLVSVPYGFTRIPESSPGITANNSIDVDGYTVAYAESIPHQYVNSVRLPLVGQLANVTTGGVIVVDPDRELWWPERTVSELDYWGTTRVRIGGVGWQSTVTATRRAWKPVGNHSVYTVSLGSDHGHQLVFASAPSTASATIDGRTLQFRPGSRFSLAVLENGTPQASVQLPARNESVEVAQLTISRSNNTLFVSHENTRIQIATYEPP